MILRTRDANHAADAAAPGTRQKASAPKQLRQYRLPTRRDPLDSSLEHDGLPGRDGKPTRRRQDRQGTVIGGHLLANRGVEFIVDQAFGEVPGKGAVTEEVGRLRLPSVWATPNAKVG